MSDLLRVENLRAGYGGEPVVQGVSLHVAKGEIVAVIGRNGVGKSTLMRALMGLIPVSQGTIALNGETINGLPTQQRAKRGIGYIPQGRDVFPRLTVRENLLVGETARRGGTPDYETVFQFFPILKERANQDRKSVV